MFPGRDSQWAARAFPHERQFLWPSCGEAQGYRDLPGTNGKTTTSFLCESILRHCGRPSALIGTIEYHVPVAAMGSKLEPMFLTEFCPSPHTTPEALELNQVFCLKRWPPARPTL